MSGRSRKISRTEEKTAGSTGSRISAGNPGAAKSEASNPPKAILRSAPMSICLICALTKRPAAPPIAPPTGTSTASPGSSAAWLGGSANSPLSRAAQARWISELASPRA